MEWRRRDHEFDSGNRQLSSDCRRHHPEQSERVTPSLATGPSFRRSDPSQRAGDILIRYTYFGDANLDGVVDGSDYSLIDAALPARVPSPAGTTATLTTTALSTAAITHCSITRSTTKATRRSRKLWSLRRICSHLLAKMSPSRWTAGTDSSRRRLRRSLRPRCPSRPALLRWCWSERRPWRRRSKKVNVA